MLDPSLTMAYLVVVTAVAFSPGPDVLFVLANGIQKKAKGAIAASLGIAIGSLCHALAAAVGISAILVSYPLAFEMLRYAGVLYLLWLGFNAMRKCYQDGGPFQPHNDIMRKTPLHIFCSGLLTNILNPKVIIFYLALLPQFVNLELGQPGVQIFLLGAIHSLIGLVYLLIIGALAGRASAYFFKNSFGRWMDGIAGTVFVALALRLMTVDLSKPN